MHVRTRVNWILTGITLSLLLPSVGSVISAYCFPYSRFPHLPFHSLLEACGGMMAIGVAGILVVEQPRRRENSHYCWMAAALFGMGVLDLFHAAVLPGNNFVWLHSHCYDDSRTSVSGQRRQQHAPGCESFRSLAFLLSCFPRIRNPVRRAFEKIALARLVCLFLLPVESAPQILAQHQLQITTSAKKEPCSFVNEPRPSVC